MLGRTATRGLKSVPATLRSSIIRQSVPVTGIRFITSSQSNKTVSPSVETVTTKIAEDKKAIKTYLDTLNNNELFGYGVIGMATLNKPILDLVIKLFPYTPIWLIKALVYKNYCGGDNKQQVLQTGERLAERGIKNMMLSLTIEACDNKEFSEGISIDYIVKESQKSIGEMLVPHTVKMIEATPAAEINDIPPGYIALKPTGLIENASEILLNYNKPEFKSKYDQLLKNCADICAIVDKSNKDLLKKYPARIAPFIVAVIDAERNDLQQGVYKLQRDLFAKFNKEQVSVVGTVQLYLKESTGVLENEKKLASEGGYKLGWKLVRGAYIHTEPERGVIFDTKEDTDINYNKNIKATIDDMNSKSPVVGHLVVASHNGDSQTRVTKMLAEIKQDKVKSNVVLGQLLGMADNVTFDLMTKYNVKNIIKYVPWGPPLETKDYLLRRLEENGDAVRADSGWPLVKDISKTFYRRFFN
ncbi:unnamed protein product [[Candida] boidinii]|nr:hypothetical protein B5S30_g1248 [[Candida] boidinii]OWB83542.1 hypothetical protein B5S33_g2173 [[Candida] boidinii]GME95850.1 unnamed protein product [[Candida] boidinii]GMG00074.1 unnamed protein product [[Candida] boidinii]